MVDTDWIKKLEPRLRKRIMSLSHQEAIAAIIYFCGYEGGADMVSDAISLDSNEVSSYIRACGK